MLNINIVPSEQMTVPIDTAKRLPAGRKFAQLLHDYEVYGVSRPTHNNATWRASGLPETVKAIFPVFVNMTKQWQLYWADLFSISRFNKLYNDLSADNKTIIKIAFRGVTAGYRAFTNRRGWDDGYADYINGVNTNSAPMQQETVNTGGNIVELLSDEMRAGGKKCYMIRTLNARILPPNPLKVNHVTEPWLIFKATISRREGYNSDTDKWVIENRVIPFDQLGGYDVPIPFTCNDTYNYIEADRIKVLPDNAIIPSPYNR